MNVEVRLLVFRPLGISGATGATGKLMALADVAVALDGVDIMMIRSIRLESLGSAGTQVRMPVNREGRAVLVLPPEVGDAVAEVVYAGGFDAGILAERPVRTLAPAVPPRVEPEGCGELAALASHAPPASHALEA